MLIQTLPSINMNRRIKFTLLLISIAVIIIALPSPLNQRARAQVGIQFGAQRFPSIDIDRNDKLYLMMAVATAPASEHRPHSQIFFVSSNDGGATWDNLPHTRNLSNSPGEAFAPALAVFKNGTP